MNSFSFFQTRKFNIKVLVRANSVLKVRPEAAQEYGYYLQRDGWLNAFTDEKSQTMRSDGIPWRGAREKHQVFFSIIFANLTDKNDVIMDWQCGVGGSILACRSIERHIVALESDPMIFNAILLPLRDNQPSRPPRSNAPPSTSMFDPPKKMTKRAFGFLCA